MVKIRRRLGITIIVVLLVGIGVLALFPACTSGESTIDLPPFDLPEKMAIEKEGVLPTVQYGGR